MTTSSTTRPESAPAERSEKGAEKTAVKTPSEMTLVGEKPTESLKAIQDLNSKVSTEIPKDFGTGFGISGMEKPAAGQDKPGPTGPDAGADKGSADKAKPGADRSLAGGDKDIAGADKGALASPDKITPPGLEFRTIAGFINTKQGSEKPHSHGDKGHRHSHASDRKGSDTPAATADQPGTTVEKTKIGNTEFSIKRDAAGKPVEFTDKNGTWAAQKDGETFVNKGDKDQARFMRGTPSIDAQGNFTFKDSDFGKTQTNFKDGRSRTEIESASGDKFAIERDSKGTATRLEDGKGTWTSTNGKNWSNENGDKRTGEPKISEQGEYQFKDGSGKVTDQADSKQLTEAKTLQEEISKKYGVTIAGGGEKHHEDKGLTSQASARELRALDDTLARSNQMDMKGLKISFLGAGQAKGEGYGVYEGNKLDLFQMSRVDPEGFVGLKGVGLHELVHHEQEKMNSEEWRGANPPPEVANMREALGWKYDQKFGPVRLDEQGGMWSPRRGENDPKEGPQTAWTYVGGRDKPPPPGEQNINAAKMEEIAKVKLASGYNSTPFESHAEAAALLRHNPEDLAKKSPEAYKALRDWDQSKIDQKQAATGGEKMIRGVDGRIVSDNAENRKAREEMERKYGI